MSLRHPLAIIILMVMAMSLVSSKAALSITMGALAFVALLDIQVNPFKIKFILTWAKLKSSIREKPFIWVFAAFWLLYFISIVYAGDFGAWWYLTHPKFAFLLLPLSFALLQPLSRKEYMLITVCMIIMAVWASIWVQVAYFSNYELFNKSLGFGASLPTPGSHIRYSTIIAISMILCLGFAIENWKIKYQWERLAYSITAVYLFCFLHILSVRSGLLIGYAGIMILTFFYLKKLKLWKQLALMAMIVMMPVIAYKFLPGFQMKVNYTLYDLGKYKEGQGDTYSDSQRWESWQVGLEIGNEHPFFGTGTGKFLTALKSAYEKKSKTYMWRPQNQLINVFAIFGLFGLSVFLIMIVYPMTFSLFWKTSMLPTLYIIQLISMGPEHVLDSEVGTFLFLLLTLIGLSYQFRVKDS